MSTLQSEAIGFNLRLERRRRLLSTTVLKLYERYITDPDRSVHDADLKNPNCLCTVLSNSDYQHDEMSRVMPLLSFMEHNTTKPYGRASLTRLRNDFTNAPHLVRYAQHGELRGERPYVWLTLTARLKSEAQLSSYSEPNGSRAILGLLHITNGVELIRLDFVPAYFDRVSIPTIVEGGKSPAFCVWSANSLECGFTWRFDRHERGIPEFVVKGARLNYDAKPIYLGPTRGMMRINYRRLLSRNTEVAG